MWPTDKPTNMACSRPACPRLTRPGTWLIRSGLKKKTGGFLRDRDVGNRNTIILYHRRDMSLVFWLEQLKEWTHFGYLINGKVENCFLVSDTQLYTLPCRSVVRSGTLQAVFALLLLPNRPRLDCRVFGVVSWEHLPLKEALFIRRSVMIASKSKKNAVL